MTELVPYSYVEQKIREDGKYQLAVAKWGAAAVDNVSIPYLVYLYNLLRKHGLLHLRGSKRDPIEQLEIVFGVNGVAMPKTLLQRIAQRKDIKVERQKRGYRKTVRRVFSIRRRRWSGRISVRCLLRK